MLLFLHHGDHDPDQVILLRNRQMLLRVQWSSHKKYWSLSRFGTEGKERIHKKINWLHDSLNKKTLRYRQNNNNNKHRLLWHHLRLKMIKKTSQEIIGKKEGSNHLLLPQTILLSETETVVVLLPISATILWIRLQETLVSGLDTDGESSEMHLYPPPPLLPLHLHLKKILLQRQQPKWFVPKDFEEVIARKQFVHQAVTPVMVTVKDLVNASASLDGQVCLFPE